MFKKIMLWLSIKPAETGLVNYLFFIQFLLGIATSFLYTSSLTLFLSTFRIEKLPLVFILAALLILIANQAYTYLERKYTSSKVLQLVIAFSLISILVLWLAVKYIDSTWLTILLAACNALVYTLLGYAFWGLSALLFNVRESKRVFSIVGSGDIPAKMIGYLSVSVLVQVIGIKNLLLISVGALVACIIFIRKSHKYAPPSNIHIAHSNNPDSGNKESLSFANIIERLFRSKLVFFISLVSLIAYIIFSFADFTFLSEIQQKYSHKRDLASFIAVFFAGGRLFDIVIKLVLSSRMISRIGILNTLLISPLLLLLINSIVIFSGGSLSYQLYVFGSMVMLIEILKSTIQEPVSFILLQPLNPYDRLKGQLIAKGYTFPIALLAVGSFLIFYLQEHKSISILYLSEVVSIFLFLWMGIVFLIKHEYVQTLIKSLKKGYFTGAELFLNDDAVSALLIEKIKSNKPSEVIYALNLLERSGYTNTYKLLIEHLQHHHSEQVRAYVVERIISNNMTIALPIIKKQIEQNKNLEKFFYKALFFLEKSDIEKWKAQLASLDNENKKAALSGLLLKKDDDAFAVAQEELAALSKSNNVNDNRLVVEVIMESGGGNFTEIIATLLQHPSSAICQKAIETAGKVKDYELFGKMYQTVSQRNEYYSFQRALVYYGDDIFDDQFFSNKIMQDKILYHIIKAASKVKGQKSEAYLIALLKKNTKNRDDIIDALWIRKSNLSADQPLIEKWIDDKLAGMKKKVDCFVSLNNNKDAHLLKNALLSEMQQDIATLLKAFSLIFDREQINRFIEVYRLDNATKMANAVELLEVTIPKKYFDSLIYFIELREDLTKQPPALPSKKHASIDKIIKEVIWDSTGNFNSWSKAVALYSLPKLVNKNVALSLLNHDAKEADSLFTETENYVLSVLK